MSDETEGPVLEKRLIDYKAITKDGLWSNNVVFAQMLALCPLLAVTGTATNGLGMGLATTAVMVTSGLLISALRSYIPADVRIPAFVLVIAALVTLVDMAIDRKSTRLNSSHITISYAVFCLKKKKKNNQQERTITR